VGHGLPPLFVQLSDHLRSLEPDPFAPGTKGATGNLQPY